MIELYVTDHQVPYHDLAVWKLQLAVARFLHPHIVFFGGDNIDCYQLSMFDKDPVRVLELQKDLDIMVGMLDVMREASKAKRKIYLPGNHEERMRRIKWRNPGLSSLRSLDMQNELHLAEMGYEWVEYKTDYKIGDLTHIHGDEYCSSGPYPAEKSLAKGLDNLIFGHHHKQQSAFLRLGNGVMLGAWAIGCSCDLNPEYVKKPQWQQGFAIIDYTYSGLFQVTPVNVFTRQTKRGLEKCCIVGGKLFSEVVV